MLFSGADVIMGGGHPGYTDDHTERDANYTWIDPGDYSSLIGGKTPFSFIEDRADFEALASADSAATQAECRADIGTQPVFGLAQVAETAERLVAALGRAFQIEGRIEDERQGIELAVSAAIHGRIARPGR